MSISDSTIRRARRSGNPVIHGNRATFIWEGRTAPHLMSYLNGWDGTYRPFKRIHPGPVSASSPLGRSVWSCSLTIPRDAYIEYAFYNAVTRERFLDPLNPRTVNNGMGSRNNFFYMPETTPSPFAVRRADVPWRLMPRAPLAPKRSPYDHEREIYL